MKAQMRHAVLGFSYDLTDPDARWIPVGAIVVGQCDEGVVAASAGIQIDEPMTKELEARLGFHMDPVSAAILRDIPGLIERQFTSELARQQVHQRRDNAGAKGVLGLLHHALRNSLHVQTISEVIEVDVRDGAHLAAQANERAINLAISEFRKFADPVVERNTKPASSPAPKSRSRTFWPEGECQVA